MRGVVAAHMNAVHNMSLAVSQSTWWRKKKVRRDNNASPAASLDSARMMMMKVKIATGTSINSHVLDVPMMVKWFVPSRWGKMPCCMWTGIVAVS